MPSEEPQTWQNRAPGNLDDVLPSVESTPVEPAISTAVHAAPHWAALSLSDRIRLLRLCQNDLREEKDLLARLITREVGKPLREARGEMDAVVAKFDLTFADAEKYITEQTVSDGPHPALVRHRPLGPVAVIAPYNFPIHLGHGAALAHLVAGNPVLFKPSPIAANTGAAYARIMQTHLPPGVFTLVQGWGKTGADLAAHPAVRGVVFTGSISAGRALTRQLAEDYSKILALELGGKNASLVFADADLESAARDIADAICLTAGQRCNATTRVLVEKKVVEPFCDLLRQSLARYVPGDPMKESTLLGPLATAAAHKRYRDFLENAPGAWILRGDTLDSIDGQRGYYVTPSLLLVDDRTVYEKSPLFQDEIFCPMAVIEPCADEKEMLALHARTPFGLSASVFTVSRERFERMGPHLAVGNLYLNLPTTFSPSTLPFGGLGISGNGRPGGRGFIRFATCEQAVQWKE